MRTFRSKHASIYKKSDTSIFEPNRTSVYRRSSTRSPSKRSVFIESICGDEVSEQLSDLYVKLKAAYQPPETDNARSQQQKPKSSLSPGSFNSKPTSKCWPSKVSRHKRTHSDYDSKQIKYAFRDESFYKKLNQFYQG